LDGAECTWKARLSASRCDSLSEGAGLLWRVIFFVSFVIQAFYF
jgi:hypothetical protein